ncbi:hypothetical protein [Serratia sp. 14-2641]|uniref:hypothetical protein n=1 Tax=Serratia sp. 14-2641 TaxID=1841657 RepID=UPI00080F8348|nr:hypothetical protein [Serratia sp. 14-2641]OCJ30620.1 hypothetical protein A6U95_06895 [Serratia sp. 14-2641]
MTISTVTNEQLRERLEIFVREQAEGETPEIREIYGLYASAFAELLAVREARSVPVAWQQRFSGDHWQSCSKSMFDYLSENPDPIVEVREVYAAPPAPALPCELLDAMAEVIRISDRDHEVWDRAKNAISACRAALTAVPTPTK